jgi:hypothetical protein
MGAEEKKIINLASREANLKRKLRRHLQSLGFKKAESGLFQVEGNSKDVIRTLHGAQREERLQASQQFIQERAPALIKYFANGKEIAPERLSPVLEKVSAGTWQGDLFRLASLTWSVPVSNGFGRRIRYLVWDAHNEKLIGLIAIGDPVFNLAVRDNLIGWDVHDRSARLVNLMDAYVLGALPPYNSLLGGKLVACLLRSRELYDDFAATYGSTTGIISGQEKKARLLAVTTSSSMGRSSVYNRLKLGGTEYLRPIGYTGGWGHFHIPDKLFSELRDYLRAIGHEYADFHRFGQGPNWRLRTTRAALDALGFREDMLRHGIQRQVFISFLAANAKEILKSGREFPDVSSLLTAAEISELAVARWIEPRSRRQPEYQSWDSENLFELFGRRNRAMRSQILKEG